MNWFISILLALPVSLLGLVGGLYVGDRCARWFRFSQVEGSAGYAVLGIGLLGGLIGLVLSMVIAGLVSPAKAAEHARAFAMASGSVAGLTALAFGICRFLAHVPPTIDGRPLMLEMELRLPIGAAAPLESEGYSSVTLHAVSRGRSIASAFANLQTDQARYESGRWIIPASIEVFTERGQRSVEFQINGESIANFLVPLPARPTRADLEWSHWCPRPPHEPWPDTKPSYRFRARIIPPPPPPLSGAEAQAKRDGEEQALLDAIPSDAPLAVRLPYTRYGVRPAIRDQAIAAMLEQPTFVEELSALMLSDDAETASDALRLISSLDRPPANLLAPVAAVGHDLALRIQNFNSTNPEDDPSYQGAADISIRFSGWIDAARTLRAHQGGDFSAELVAILELSRLRPDSHALRQDVCRVASFYANEWLGLEPLPTDPKPR